jgi:hypothetical protein
MPKGIQVVAEVRLVEQKWAGFQKWAAFQKWCAQDSFIHWFMDFLG